MDNLLSRYLPFSANFYNDIHLATIVWWFCQLFNELRCEIFPLRPNWDSIMFYEFKNKVLGQIIGPRNELEIGNS